MTNVSDLKDHYKISSWGIFSLIGKDAQRFLNGQVTSDVSKLSIGLGQLTSRVSRTGSLNYFGYLFCKSLDEYFIISPNYQKDSFAEDLEKFIIMDEVEVAHKPEAFSICFDEKKSISSDFHFVFLGKLAGLNFKKAEDDLDAEILNKLTANFGLPQKNRFYEGNKLINNFSLVDTSVSNDKGCYVGQETIKKIELNRGAGKKDVLLKTTSSEKSEEIKVGDDNYKVIDFYKNNDESYFIIEAKRELRVNHKKVNVLINNEEYLGEVLLFPIDSISEKDIAVNLYEKGIQLFTEGEDLLARDYLNVALKFSPENPDILESLGALQGRLNNLTQAIELMDRLESVDPNSVMAHTNKSLFYMRLGEIEKAEDEKAKATLKGFNQTAKTSNTEQKKEEVRKRLAMYKEVLEIDNEDEMANMGAAQIYFDMDLLDESQNHIKTLLDVNEANSKALSIMAKILIKQKDEEKALTYINKALDIASKKGDFIIANEMQSLANSLMSST